MTEHDPQTFLLELHRSLDERWRPEDVAQKVVVLLDLEGSERRTLEKAVEAGRTNFWFTMSRDFQRPCSMSRQLQAAQELFGRKVAFASDDAEQIEAWIKDSEKAIGKTFNQNDFKHDRLPKRERMQAGIELSRRRYNKQFRLAVRLEKKLNKLRREQFKRAVEAAMRAYASRFGEDSEKWGIVGLLHDFDYERWPNPPDQPLKGAEILAGKGYPADVIYAIKSHADYLTDCPRVSRLDKTLYACDELAGFVTAVALLRPEKLSGMQASSVKKKMKQKSFAAAVSRDDIVRGAEDLGVPLDEHIQFVIEGMQAAAAELGL